MHIDSENYKLKIGVKTHFLNFFRRIFKIRPFENLLIKKIENLPVNSYWVRLMPPNYLYEKHSFRKAQRNGINYYLDISDYMEHTVYFGYKDIAVEKLIQLSQDKKVLIDVGTNIGIVLLNWAKHSPDSLIYGFEPDSQNYLKAKKNLELNKFKNITLTKKGLGSSPATVKLFNVNDSNAGMKRIFSDNSEQLDSNLSFDEIEIITLDEFVELNSLSQIDLIKIDVEGYELKILEGAKKTLKHFHPILFIELDDSNLRTQNDSAQNLILFLESLGYKIFNADNDSEVKSDDNFSYCHFDIICRV